MTKTKKIWTVVVVFWLFIWLVFAIEVINPQLGLSPSILTYSIAGPILFALGIWWIRKG